MEVMIILLNENEYPVGDKGETIKESYVAIVSMVYVYAGCELD